MLVSNRMTTNPVTVAPEDLLDKAAERMKLGSFHRVPVVSEGKLVGILSDRDIRAHAGHWDQVKVNGVMTENPRTVAPATTIEEAAQIMLKHQFGGLPVVENGTLVGMITITDVTKAFLDVMGASDLASARIDFVLEGEEHSFVEASRTVVREGGQVLGVGTYRAKLGDNPVCYLRLLSGNPDKIAKALQAGGFDVLGVHRIGAS